MQQKLSNLDAVAFVDRQVDDAPRRVGADVDQTLRLNLAGRRDDRLEIAGLDAFGRDQLAGILLEVQVRSNDRRAYQHNGSCDQNVLPRHLALLTLRRVEF